MLPLTPGSRSGDVHLGDLREERPQVRFGRTPTASWARQSSRGDRTAPRGLLTRSCLAPTGATAAPHHRREALQLRWPASDRHVWLVIPRFVGQVLSGQDLTVYEDGEQRLTTVVLPREERCSARGAARSSGGCGDVLTSVPRTTSPSTSSPGDPGDEIVFRVVHVR
jgi:hypothetical protein